MPQMIGSRAFHLKLSFLPLVVLLTGCSHRFLAPDMMLSLRDGTTGEPIEGIRINRVRPLSFPEKLLSPIRAAYFPTTAGGSALTDRNGEVAFRNWTIRDVYYIHTDSRRVLEIVAWGKQVRTRPSVSLDWAGEAYAVWTEDGLLKCRALRLQK